MALALEAGGIMGEVQDAKFRPVFTSTEAMRVFQVSTEEAEALLGVSRIVRSVRGDASIMRVTHETGAAWFEQNAPIMRRYLESDDEDFEAVFGPTAEYAATLDPVERPPRAWHSRIEFRDIRVRENLLGGSDQVYIRLNDDTGEFIGVLVLDKPVLPDSLVVSLARGDKRMLERMGRLSEPAKRSAAILFADLEASGELSRRLSSRGYFDLIRDVTDVIDASVIAADGIVGKHAGDGGSALFVTDDFEGRESGAARAAMESARRIRDGARDLGPDGVSVLVNVGLHWGSTLTIGQVATRGRLEVTALGDQMNEGARIESATAGGAVLASKELIERLGPDDAAALGLDPDTIAYTPLGDLDGVSPKAARDAGAIAVAKV